MSERTHVCFDAPDLDPDRLAEAVRDGLVRRGFAADEPDDLHFARSLEVARDGVRWTVVLGHVGDPDGREWLVFLDPGKGRGLFRRQPPPSTAPLAAAVEEVLLTELAVVPQWFTDAEFGSGRDVRGTPDS